MSNEYFPPQTEAGGRAEVKDPSQLVDGDFYMDGPYLVFTAAYHLRRGSCCHSQCRHCPYGEPQG